MHKKSLDGPNHFCGMFLQRVCTSSKSYLAKKRFPQKALLLIGNALSHPFDELQSDNGKIQCLFFPVNTIEPMNQGIIENMKYQYKKCFIESWP